MPLSSESILGLKVEALRGKQVSLESTETSEGSGNAGTTLSSSRLSCGERLFLRCDGNAGNSFPTTQGKDPSSRARRPKRGSSGCGRDSRASSRVETGMSGKFLSCSKGVKGPLEVPEVRCDEPRDASAEMGLISPGEENLLDFLELRQVLSTYDGDLRDPLWWTQERPVPLRVARVLLGIPLP